MKEICGRYNYALIYTDVVDVTSLKQVQLLCNQAFIEGLKIRMMPDSCWRRLYNRHDDEHSR
jgi:hypothetical protein